jgi:hypothetical protein
MRGSRQHGRMLPQRPASRRCERPLCRCSCQDRTCPGCSRCHSSTRWLMLVARTVLAGTGRRTEWLLWHQTIDRKRSHRMECSGRCRDQPDRLHTPRSRSETLTQLLRTCQLRTLLSTLWCQSHQTIGRKGSLRMEYSGHCRCRPDRARMPRSRSETSSQLPRTCRLHMLLLSMM